MRGVLVAVVCSGFVTPMRRPKTALQSSRVDLSSVQAIATEFTQSFKTNFDQGIADAAPEVQVLVAGQAVLILLLLVGVVPFGGLLEFIAGPGLILGGIALSVVGFFELGANNVTPFATPVKDNQLKTNGVYALTRHPMYVGLIALAVGLAVASHSFQRVVVALLLYLLLDYKAAVEEEMLVKIHEGYAAYQSLVPKFLPNIMFLMRSDDYFSSAFVTPEAVQQEADAIAEASALADVTKQEGDNETPPTSPEK